MDTASPNRYDEVRCYRVHTAGDPLLGEPIAARLRPPREADRAGGRPRPGLEPKTVVNAHRMLHRAWEDFTAWGWARRNVIRDAHPPYVAPERSQGLVGQIDWKTLSERIGHSDVAFTMRQYAQTDLEVHRQVATALAELIRGGVTPAPGSPVARRDGPHAAGKSG